jgi:hypothetical protein
VWGAACAALAACYAPEPPGGLPCALSGDCPAGQTCSPRGVCLAPGAGQIWRDDAADDFAAAGSILEGAEIEPAGFVAPVPYLAGGAHITGLDRTVIGADTTWAALAAIPAAGRTLARGLALDYEGGIPPGLGLSSADNFTLLVEAEVLLEQAGDWRLELTADDRGFLEVAPPGSDQLARVVSDEDRGTVAPYVVTTPGWHRLRVALSDARADATMRIRWDPPDPPTSLRPIPMDKIRARVGALTGLLVEGFAHPYLLGPAGSVVAPLASQSLGDSPFGLPTGATFSLRWSGQIYIDPPGRYSLSIASAYGHRAWLDGAQVADALGAEPRSTVTEPRELAAGWHDLAIDTHRLDATAAKLTVEVVSGPAGTAGPLAPARARPVVGRAVRWVGAGSTFAQSIPDGAALGRPHALELPQGFTVGRVDVGAEVSHSALETVAVTTTPPGGPAVTLAAAGTLTGTGARLVRGELPPPATGTQWSLTARDTAVDGMTGSLRATAVTAHGSGGLPPLATRAALTSAPRDLGGPAVIGAVRVGLRRAEAPAEVAVLVRTCAAAAECAAAPWTPVADGAVPAVPAQRFAQYRVELVSGGDVPVALDWIELPYQVD